MRGTRCSLSWENLQLNDIYSREGTANIKKLFDVLLRPLAYILARLAGMPSKILVPYQRYLEAFRYLMR